MMSQRNLMHQPSQRGSIHSSRQAQHAFIEDQQQSLEEPLQARQVVLEPPRSHNMRKPMSSLHMGSATRKSQAIKMNKNSNGAANSTAMIVNTRDAISKSVSSLKRSANESGSKSPTTLMLDRNNTFQRVDTIEKDAIQRSLRQDKQVSISFSQAGMTDSILALVKAGSQELKNPQNEPKGLNAREANASQGTLGGLGSFVINRTLTMTDQVPHDQIQDTHSPIGGPTMMTKDQIDLLTQKKSHQNFLNGETKKVQLVGINNGGPLRLSFQQRIKSLQKIGATSNVVEGFTPASRANKPNTTFDPSQRRSSTGKKHHDAQQSAVQQFSADVSKNYSKYTKEPNRDLDLVVQEISDQDQQECSGQQLQTSEINLKEIYRPTEGTEPIYIQSFRKAPTSRSHLLSQDSNQQLKNRGTKDVADNYDSELLYATAGQNDALTIVKPLQSSNYSAQSKLLLQKQHITEHASTLSAHSIPTGEPITSPSVLNATKVSARVIAVGVTQLEKGDKITSLQQVSQPQVIELKASTNRPTDLQKKSKQHLMSDMLAFDSAQPQQVRQIRTHPMSVQFQVQPKSNVLMTPNHPLFMNQIKNIQHYQDKVLSKSRKKCKVKKKEIFAGSQAEFDQIKKQQVQVSGLESSRGNPLDQYLDLTVSQRSSTRKPNWVESRRVSQIDPSIITEAAMFDNRRCKTSFQIKKESKHTSFHNSTMRSSLCASTGQAVQKQKKLSGETKTSISKLPYQYQNHNDIHLKKKLTKQQMETELGVLGEQRSLVPFKTLIDQLKQKKQALAQLQKQSQHKQNHHRRNQKVMSIKSQEETLRLRQQSEQKSALPSENDTDQLLKSSLEILLREHGDDVDLQGVIDSSSLTKNQKLSRTRRKTTSYESSKAAHTHTNQSSKASHQHIMSSKFAKATFPSVMSQLSDLDYQDMHTNKNQKEKSTLSQPTGKSASLPNQAENQSLQPLSLSPSNIKSPVKYEDSNSTVRKLGADQLVSVEKQKQANETALVDEQRSKNLLSKWVRTPLDSESLNLAQKQERNNLSESHQLQNAGFYAGQGENSEKTTHQAPPSVTISINKKQQQNNCTTLSSNRQSVCLTKKNANISEDVVNQFTNDNLHESEFLKRQSSGIKQNHFQKLQHLQQRARPLSQNLHRRHNTQTQSRLQELFKRKKQTLLSSMNGTPSCSFRDAVSQDKHRVLSGSSPHHQFGDYLTKYGVADFNLAQDNIQDDNSQVHQLFLARGQQQYEIDGNFDGLTDLPDHTQEQIEVQEQLRKVITVARQSQLPFERTIAKGRTSNTGLNYSYTPAILHHLESDLQFRQVFKGIPLTRQVHTKRSSTSLSLYHQGKFNFAAPSEIQYELRKKRCNHPNPLSQSKKVRGMRSSTSQEVMEDYQMVMHVPAKLVSKESPTRHVSPSKHSANEANKQVEESNRTNIAKSRSQVSNTHKKQENELTVRAERHYREVFAGADNNSQSGVSTEGFQSLQQKSSLQQRKGSIGTQGSAQISQNDSNSSPLFSNKQKIVMKSRKVKTRQTAIVRQFEQFHILTNPISTKETILRDPPIPLQKTLQSVEEQPTAEPASPIRRTVELNLNDLGESTHLIDSQQEPEDANISSRFEGVSTKKAVFARQGSVSVHQSCSSKEVEVLPEQLDAQDYIPVSGDEITTMPFSMTTTPFVEQNTPMVQVSDFGAREDGTVTLLTGNNKNWFDSFAARTTTVVSKRNGSQTTSKGQSQTGKRTRSSNQSRRTKSDLPSNYTMLGLLGHQDVFLNQTLRQINHVIPLAHTNSSSESQGQPTAAISMLRKHQERVINHRLQASQQGRRQKKGNSVVQTRAVSKNVNLIRNKKSNNLSSYAHPKNSQIQKADATEQVEL